MKFTIALLTLAISANVTAASVGHATAITIATPFLTSLDVSGKLPKLQANAVLNDAQDLLQTGVASLFLSQKIREIQSLNVDISEEEALDILIDSAQSILSK